MTNAIGEIREAYLAARAEADKAWRAYYEAIDAATVEAEERGLRSLTDDPELLGRLKQMRRAAVEANSKAKAVYGVYMDALRKRGRSLGPGAEG